MKVFAAPLIAATAASAESPVVRVHASAGSSFVQKYDDITIDSRAASFLQKDLAHWATTADAPLVTATRAPIYSMSFIETPGVIDVASTRSFLQSKDIASNIRAGGSVALEALSTQTLDSAAIDAAREVAARESSSTSLRIAALKALARTSGTPAASNVVDANGDMIASTVVVPSFLEAPHVRVIY